MVKATTADWEYLESNPADHYFGMFQSDAPTTRLMTDVRNLTARFFGCALDELALMPSTTISFNTVATGMVESGWLGEGDVVLTSDQEHAGGLLGWEHYAKAGLINLTKVTLNPPSPNMPPASVGAVVAEFEKAVRSADGKVKVLSVSHVLTTSGVRLPIKQLSTMAHRYNISVVVDGAQAPGGLHVNVTELGCDAYATSAHKWMLAPKGNGVLYVAKRIQQQLSVTWLDEGYGVYTGSTGTRPAATILGLGHAIDYLNSFGMDKVEAHNLNIRALAWKLVEALKVPGLVFLSAKPETGLGSQILTLQMPPNVSEATVAGKMFTQKGFVVKQAADFGQSGAPAPAAIRIGFHLYNSEADVRAMVAALGEVLDAEIRGSE